MEARAAGTTRGVASQNQSWLPVGLTYVAGYVDAIGYLVLAGTFVGHMSGNTVRFGIALGHGDWGAAIFAGFPIPFFVLGTAVGAAIPDRSRGVPLFLEAVLLAVFTLLAGLLHLADPSFAPTVGAYIGAGSLLVFAFALQNSVLKQRSGGVQGTTFVSGVLANIGELTTDSIVQTRQRDSKAPETRAKLQRFLAMFGGYLAGGISGTLVLMALALPAFVVPVLLLLVLGVLDMRIPPASN